MYIVTILLFSSFSLSSFHACQIPNVGPVIAFPTPRTHVEEPHCNCHVKVTDNTTRTRWILRACSAATLARKYIILCQSRGQGALNGSVLLLVTGYLT